MRRYRHSHQSDITCMVLDDRQRKFISGDNSGNIVVRSHTATAEHCAVLVTHLTCFVDFRCMTT